MKAKRKISFKNRCKRVISWLLCLSLMLGLYAANSMMVYAAEDSSQAETVTVTKDDHTKRAFILKKGSTDGEDCYDVETVEKNTEYTLYIYQNPEWCGAAFTGIQVQIGEAVYTYHLGEGVVTDWQDNPVEGIMDYSQRKLTIYADAVVDDIVITALQAGFGNPNSYPTVSKKLTGVTATRYGIDRSAEEQLSYNEDYMLYLKAEEGKELNYILITIGEERYFVDFNTGVVVDLDLNENENITYELETGKLVIKQAAWTGDIVITATALNVNETVTVTKYVNKDEVILTKGDRDAERCYEPEVIEKYQEYTLGIWINVCETIISRIDVRIGDDLYYVYPSDEAVTDAQGNVVDDVIVMKYVADDQSLTILAEAVTDDIVISTKMSGYPGSPAANYEVTKELDGVTATRYGKDRSEKDEKINCANDYFIDLKAEEGKVLSAISVQTGETVYTVDLETGEVTDANGNVCEKITFDPVSGKLLFMAGAVDAAVVITAKAVDAPAIEDTTEDENTQEEQTTQDGTTESDVSEEEATTAEIPVDTTENGASEGEATTAGVPEATTEATGSEEADTTTAGVPEATTETAGNEEASTAEIPVDTTESGASEGEATTAGVPEATTEVAGNEEADTTTAGVPEATTETAGSEDASTAEIPVDTTENGASEGEATTAGVPEATTEEAGSEEADTTTAGVPEATTETAGSEDASTAEIPVDTTENGASEGEATTAGVPGVTTETVGSEDASTAENPVDTTENGASEGEATTAGVPDVTTEAVGSEDADITTEAVGSEEASTAENPVETTENGASEGEATTAGVPGATTEVAGNEEADTTTAGVPEVTTETAGSEDASTTEIPVDTTENGASEENDPTTAGVPEATTEVAGNEEADTTTAEVPDATTETVGSEDASTTEIPVDTTENGTSEEADTTTARVPDATTENAANTEDTSTTTAGNPDATTANSTPAATTADAQATTQTPANSSATGQPAANNTSVTQQLTPDCVTVKATIKYRKNLTPVVKVCVNGVALQEGTDYTITCNNTQKPGQASVTIKGCGKYAGEVTKSFVIVPNKVKISSVKSKKSKNLTVKWTKAAGVSGYAITISTDKNFKKNKTVKATKANTVTFKKLAKKKYYVRVRSYVTVDGKKYYGTNSSIKKVNIK